MNKSFKPKFYHYLFLLEIVKKAHTKLTPIFNNFVNYKKLFYSLRFTTLSLPHLKN